VSRGAPRFLWAVVVLVTAGAVGITANLDYMMPMSVNMPH
jgi:hypothetical protein